MRTAEILGTELEILGAQLQILGAPTPKEIVTLQKERLRLCVAIWAYSSSIEHNENKYKNQNISHELSLDVNYSSSFVQYPHYPISCCLPHNCHGKSINLTAKIITSPCGKRKRLAAKRKTSRQKERLKAKRKPHGKKKKTRGKFLRYREDILILISFAVRSWLFFLP